MKRLPRGKIKIIENVPWQRVLYEGLHRQCVQILECKDSVHLINTESDGTLCITMSLAPEDVFFLFDTPYGLFVNGVNDPYCSGGKLLKEIKR